MTLAGARVLVTGAAGFLASHVVRRLLASGAEVHGWVRPTTDAWRLAEMRSRLTLHQVDLREADQVRQAVDRIRPSVCFHLAAYGLSARQHDWDEAVRTNVLGTTHLLQALGAGGCQRLVYTTTCHEYASKAEALNEEDPVAPLELYGSTKAAATAVVRAWASGVGLPTVVLRLFGVYGPYDGTNKLIPNTITALLSRQVAAVSPCEVVRDYTYVDDIVEGILRSAEASLSGVVTINLGSGQPVSLRQLVEAIAAQLGGRVEFGAIPPRAGEAQSLWADVRRAETLLHWRATVSWEDGLRRTIAWFRTHARHEPLSSSAGTAHG
ncbi:MAG: NAD-dependent epimerase/dehydratase family protein [Candidatus Omnitrophica bacterium]|nr:NAD-dependent epimerase/dehydratase family protein [Candidatus Omnitrophota bacterium]